MAAPRVSDHAMLRWLERAGGLDVEGLREHLAQSLARAHVAASRLDATDYLIVADGLAYVVRKDIVATVLPEGSIGTRFHALAHGARGE